ncbi:MAG: hypothetical protein ACMX3H_20080 [Sodalis sp. (in: enterobacteria)]|uniref:hypothetical protein n=1 Tax=Sodalis sp. (in: enterobacteria) TaxID=1898979 RepID=UPI0039E2FB01
MRLRDPVLNVLTSAGCANFAKASALLNTCARPAFGDQNPPAVHVGEALTATGADHYDFKGEVPSFEVTLPLKVIDRQPHHLLVTLVDVVSGKGVGRQYAIVAHHPVPMTAASRQAVATPAEGDALAPAAPATHQQPVPDRFTASRTLYEGLHPSVPLLILQLERAVLRAGGFTLSPLARPLKSFMPPTVFIDLRYDTSYLNYCNMVANYPGARQFHLHGLTQ